MAGYIGPIPVPQATQTRETFTATASQTTFNTAGYQPGYLDVFMNGVKLIDGSDYTATNGSDVVLSSGAAVNDLIEVVAYTAFEVLNQNFTGTTTVADLTVTGDLTVDGTTTTINSTTLNVDDINITVASGAADAAAANGAGLTVDGANATFNYASSGDKWTMNKDLDITGDLSLLSGGRVNSIIIGDGDAGLLFNSHSGSLDGVLPYNLTTSTIDNGNIDLGGASNKFRNLYLSGEVNLADGSASWRGLKGSNLGYGSGSTYKVTQVGATSGTNNVALGVDVSGNTSGAFTGYRDIFVSNDAGLYQPNSTNDDYHHLMGWDDNETVFNDSGRDRDFRVESDNNANLFFVDGGNGALAFGNSANTGQYAGTGNNGMGVNLVGQAGQYVTVQNQTDANIYLTKKSGYTDNRFIQFSQNNTTVGQITSASTGTIFDVTASNNSLRLTGGNSSYWLTGAGIYAGNSATRDLGTNDYRWKDLYLSGGIQFDSRSNKLDDYEDGTWTPAFVGWSSGLTYNYQHGWYTKIGDVCHVSFYLNFVLSSASGTNLRFNVPFTGKSGLGQDYQGGRLMRASGLTVSNPEDFSFGIYNQTALYLYDLTGGVLNYTSGFQTGIIAGQFTYKTT
jgi:hypothetical protein